VSDDDDEDEDEEDDEEDAEEDAEEDEDDDDDEEEDDVDADLEDYLTRVNYGQQGLEVYDEEEAHGPDHYHPGELKLLDEDGGEFTEKELRSNVPQRTQPDLFEWTCCGALGNEQGCEEKDEFNSEPGIKEKYPLPTESKKRRRDDDDDDDEDGWDDEDDEEDEDDEDDEDDAF
tara:strand:+ start:843 stop:1364 length:522 start_codon:yes stop_codon:yes gene_type:complete